MKKLPLLSLLLIITLFFSTHLPVRASQTLSDSDTQSLLTEPFLQLPEQTSVHVVWFTEFESKDNRVLLYENENDTEPYRTARAFSRKLSRIRGGNTAQTLTTPF